MSNGAKLVTCPVHWWSGPNVVLVEGAVAVCWDGHTLDEATARRLAA